MFEVILTFLFVSKKRFKNVKKSLPPSPIFTTQNDAVDDATTTDAAVISFFAFQTRRPHRYIREM